MTEPDQPRPLPPDELGFERIVYEKVYPRATVTLNRPEVLNAFDFRMLRELARAFDAMRVQLAQLDNARKEFVANASHELRTPLFSIGGFLELLADEELDDDTRRGFIETMQGQVQRLAKLSTDLLDLSRVDAGQLSVVREPVNLGSVVHMLAGEIDAAQSRINQLHADLAALDLVTRQFDPG